MPPISQARLPGPPRKPVRAAPTGPALGVAAAQQAPKAPLVTQAPKAPRPPLVILVTLVTLVTLPTLVTLACCGLVALLAGCPAPAGDREDAGCPGPYPWCVDGGDASGPGADAEPKDPPCPEIVSSWGEGGRPYSPWCGDMPFPGEDPNGVALIEDPAVTFAGFSLDGTRVVYARAETVYPDPDLDLEIYSFDLTWWQERRVTELPGAYQEYPKLSESRVVWTDRRYDVGGEHRYEIVERDISDGSERRVTDSPGAKYAHGFDGARLLYSTLDPVLNEESLRLLDMATRFETELFPSTSLYISPTGESLGSRYVAWVAVPPGRTDLYNRDVYVHDIQAGETRRLSSTRCAYTGITSVSGARVAWSDWRNGNWDIYLYDVETGEEHQLTDDPYDQYSPRLRGNLVLFIDHRYTGGGADDWSCAQDLSILDIDTGVLRRVTRASWFWTPRLGEAGRVIAQCFDAPAGTAPSRLFFFDLVAVGVLDASARHVVPE